MLAGNVSFLINRDCSVISHTLVIYLAVLSGRIPVLPPLVPHASLISGEPHIRRRAFDPLPVSEVFDLSHLYNVLSQPVHQGYVGTGLKGIIEAQEIVSAGLEESQRLKIGCWTTVDQSTKGKPRMSDSKALHMVSIGQNVLSRPRRQQTYVQIDLYVRSDSWSPSPPHL